MKAPALHESANDTSRRVPMNLQHGADIERLLETRPHDQLIRRLGTLIVVLSVVLGYLMYTVERMSQ